MQILIFTNENLLQEKMQEIISNANLSQQISEKVTNIYKHTTLDKWWFYRDPCEHPSCVNGGSSANTDLINQCINDGDCIQEDKTKQELIDEGYLPPEEEI